MPVLHNIKSFINNVRKILDYFKEYLFKINTTDLGNIIKYHFILLLYIILFILFKILLLYIISSFIRYLASTVF